MQEAEPPRNGFCLLACRCLQLPGALKPAQSSHSGIRDQSKKNEGPEAPETSSRLAPKPQRDAK